jgi:hypothetical protein
MAALKKKRSKKVSVGGTATVHHKKKRKKASKKTDSKIASITKYKSERGIAVKKRLEGVVKDLDHSKRVVEDALLGM